MKRTVLILILMQISLSAAALGQIAEEKKTVDSKQYTYTRRLKDYTQALEDSFAQYIKILKKGDVWLDSGAGDALAQVDYLKSGGQATVVAIDARETENRETLETRQNFPLQFRYLRGRYTETYTPQELYPLKLVTDVCGAIAYSSHLDKVLTVILNSLAPGGRLYFEMDDSTAPLSVNLTGDRLIINKVVDGNETSVPVADYFRAIKGAEFKVGHAEYGGNTIGTYFIRNSDKVDVPPLVIKEYQEGAPSKKIYTWN